MTSVQPVLDHHPGEDHDPLSVQNFHIARFIPAVPTKGKIWTPPYWRLNQKQTGHCGGFASTNELGASPFRFRPGKGAAPNDYAHQFYYDAKDWKYDPWGREDGTSTLAMMKVGQRLKAWDNYAWAKTVDDLKRNLAVGPFLFGIPYRTDMFHPNRDGWIEATGAEEGGHLMCGYGWSTNWRAPSGKTYGPTAHFVQSWGADFGQGGLIHVSLNGAADLLANGEAGVPINRELVKA